MRYLPETSATFLSLNCSDASVNLWNTKSGRFECPSLKLPLSKGDKVKDMICMREWLVVLTEAASLLAWRLDNPSTAVVTGLSLPDSVAVTSMVRFAVSLIFTLASLTVCLSVL